MIIGINLINKLPIKLNNLLKPLPNQAPHTLINLIILFFLLLMILLLFRLIFGQGPKSQIGVDGEVGIDFQNGVGLFAGLAAVFTTTDLFYVGTFPGGLFLQFLDDVLLEDQDQAVQAEFLLAGGRLVVLVALVHHLRAEFAHVAQTHLHECDGAVLVEGNLPQLFGSLLFNVRLLFFMRLIYRRILLCHIVNNPLKSLECEAKFILKLSDRSSY